MFPQTDTSPLAFHDAGIADIPTIRALADSIWRISYAAMLLSAQIDYMLDWMYGAEAIAGEMAAGVLWQLAFRGGKPSGYLSVTVHPGGAAELHKLYLLPGLQGRGLGQVMLRHAVGLAEAHGCTSLTLRVNKNNTRALQAYRRAGFRVTEAVLADIGGGFVMDDLVLTRALGRNAEAAHGGHTLPE